MVVVHFYTKKFMTIFQKTKSKFGGKFAMFCALRREFFSRHKQTFWSFLYKRNENQNVRFVWSQNSFFCRLKFKVCQKTGHDLQALIFCL